jgi:cbb3-type cytochrome oxidase subunit 3
MFEIISNPFMEMAQGVATNGLGYIAEKSSKSNNFGWLWWLLVPIVLVIMGLVYIAYQDKKKKELEEAWKRKLEEDEKKLSEKQKEITS